jgi:hypothetical protein
VVVANLCDSVWIGRHRESAEHVNLLTTDAQGNHNQMDPRGARSHCTEVHELYLMTYDGDTIKLQAYIGKQATEMQPRQQRRLSSSSVVSRLRDAL